MIILQAGVATSGAMRLYDYGLLGIIVVMLGLVVVYLFKNNKNDDKEEKARLLKANDEKTEQNNILYSEIKDIQKEHSDKLMDILLKTNETQNKVVDALNKSTEALNNNSNIFQQLIKKF